MDLTNWALRTSPKFTTGVYSSIRVFDQMTDTEIPFTFRSQSIDMVFLNDIHFSYTKNFKGLEEELKL